MNLDSTLQSLLDTPTKAFEVALRSYVADKMLAQYPEESVLKAEIQNRMATIKTTGTILSGKLSSLKVHSSKEWDSFWSNMQFSYICFMSQEHTISHDVVFLSQTILMTYLFQDLFNPFIISFGSPEKYISQSNNYYEVRNSLSHQGSTIIDDDAATKSIHFMRNSIRVIDKKYFWFRTTAFLEKDFKAFETALYSKKPRIENFADIPFPTNAIVCRETEISDLFKYTCGWNGNKRLRNRKHLVCVTGYGGIGKTALVTEFISRLSDYMENEEYNGLRPMFILFFSAKTQSLEYDKNSGDLYLKNCRKQFSNFDELLIKINNALSITEFDDDWDFPGVLVIDNLETLPNIEREKIIDYIESDLPSSIQTIVTTRIPEHADEIIQLCGFQNEAGKNFIREYLEKNSLNVSLTETQQQDLIRNSYGNSLVLVLALKRMASGRTSYREIIGELKRLPKNFGENYISQFMFQNTIEELYKQYPRLKETISNVMVCLSVRPEPLSAEILSRAIKGSTVEEILEVLQVLTQYLVVEKTGELYTINEFANHFVITSMPQSPVSNAKLESDLLYAIRRVEEQKMSISDFKEKYSTLSQILSDWSGKEESESLAICHAFSLYDYKNRISRKNAAYEIEALDEEFAQIEHSYSAHPYVYYQYARILKELRQEGVIKDEYNERIKSKFNSCLMLIATPLFAHIKNTYTYPSILWIYSQFLNSVGSFEQASHYSNDAIINFDKLKAHDYCYYDAHLIFGIAEINLFKSDYEKTHLRNARTAQKEGSKYKKTTRIVSDHLEELTELLDLYSNFSV